MTSLAFLLPPVPKAAVPPPYRFFLCSCCGKQLYTSIDDDTFICEACRIVWEESSAQWHPSWVPVHPAVYGTHHCHWF